MTPPPGTGNLKIIHLRIDAFCAAVEQRDTPQLKGRPILIGTETGDGTLVSASREAQEMGAFPAMPLRRALRLCPDAVRLDPDFDKYSRVTAEIHTLMRDYTDLIEPAGSGQTYLDVTYNKADIPFGHRVAQLIKADIRRDLGLSAIAGVGPGKFVAKIAADLKNSDGLVAVPPQQVGDFLQLQPLSVLPGIGRTTRQKLEDMDLKTLGDLAAVPRLDLISVFGKRGALLADLANGIDEEPVKPEREPEQLNQERLFPAALYDADEMHQTLRQLAEELAARLRRRRLSGRVITLKARHPDFSNVIRSRTLPLRTNSQSQILRHAQELLERTQANKHGVRFLGLSVSGFGEEEIQQLSFFASGN
jgi:DNA polymerase IV